MDEKDFSLLRTLNETQSITRAAEQLYMTQSALSKRVRAIEQDLGAELLVRSRQGVRFTPAGESVLAHCGAAANELEQMRRELEGLAGIVSGTLHAGISISYALYRLPGFMAAYHRQYPDVKLDITTGKSGQLYRRMVEGELDVAIIRGKYPWDGEQFLLRDENICLIHSREYIGVPLSDYLYIRQISTQENSKIDLMKTRWLRENGLNANSTDFCVDSVAVCVELVERGLGWSLVPEVGLQNFDGCVTPCIFKEGESFGRQTYLLCQRDVMGLPQVRAFAELLQQHG